MECLEGVTRDGGIMVGECIGVVDFGFGEHKTSRNAEDDEMFKNKRLKQNIKYLINKWQTSRHQTFMHTLFQILLK